jgi:large subunit ribosomal protein L6e
VWNLVVSLPLSLSTMVKTLRASRNKEVVRGVGRHGRSKMYHKRGLWAIKDKNGGSFPSHEKVAAVEVAAVRAPKFYPADDVKKPLHKNKVINAPKLRQVFPVFCLSLLESGSLEGYSSLWRRLLC